MEAAAKNIAGGRADQAGTGAAKAGALLGRARTELSGQGALTLEKALAQAEVSAVRLYSDQRKTQLATQRLKEAEGRYTAEQKRREYGLLTEEQTELKVRFDQLEKNVAVLREWSLGDVDSVVAKGVREAYGAIRHYQVGQRMSGAVAELKDHMAQRASGEQGEALAGLSKVLRGLASASDGLQKNLAALRKRAKREAEAAGRMLAKMGAEGDGDGVKAPGEGAGKAGDAAGEKGAKSGGEGEGEGPGKPSGQGGEGEGEGPGKPSGQGGEGEGKGPGKPSGQGGEGEGEGPGKPSGQGGEGEGKGPGKPSGQGGEGEGKGPGKPSGQGGEGDGRGSGRGRGGKPSRPSIGLSAGERRELAAEAAVTLGMLKRHVEAGQFGSEQTRAALKRVTEGDVEGTLATDQKALEQVAGIVARLRDQIEQEMEQERKGRRLAPMQREDAPDQYRELVNKYLEALATQE